MTGQLAVIAGELEPPGEEGVVQTAELLLIPLKTCPAGQLMLNAAFDGWAAQTATPLVTPVIT